MKKIAIIPASGNSKRMKNIVPKQYIKLNNNKSVLDTTIHNLLIEEFFDIVIILVRPNDKCYWSKSIYIHDKRVKICKGSRSRFNTVFMALKTTSHLLDLNDWLFVHDAARPCIQIKDIKTLYFSVLNLKMIGGCLTTPIFDTLKKISNRKIISSINRNHIFCLQTPQLFQYSTLLKAYKYCEKHKIITTDDVSAVELLSNDILMCTGSKRNIKVTVPEDINIVNDSVNKNF